MNQINPESPSSRQLVHPGTPSKVRIQCMGASSAQHVRLQLKPEQTLHNSIIEQLFGYGITSASITILGGEFAALQYCVAPPDPSKQAVIRYSKTINAGNSELIFGNATVGINPQGQATLHCHAAFINQSGESRGGHIIATHSVIGKYPFSALVTSLDDFNLQISLDHETNIAVFKPEAKLGTTHHE
jgi:predicted DNA-binding protein with PD1-like motif